MVADATDHCAGLWATWGKDGSPTQVDPQVHDDSLEQGGRAELRHSFSGDENSVVLLAGRARSPNAFFGVTADMTGPAGFTRDARRQETAGAVVGSALLQSQGVARFTTTFNVTLVRYIDFPFSLMVGWT